MALQYGLDLVSKQPFTYQEQCLYSPDRMHALTNKNINDICNVIRKSCDKNADRMPDRGQQVSFLVQKNLELATFLFYHGWRCTFEWEVMAVEEDTVHLLIGQRRPQHMYKDPKVLPKVNKADMAGMKEAIEGSISVLAMVS